MYSDLSYIASNILNGDGDGGDADGFSINVDVLSNFTSLVANDTDGEFAYDPCDPNVYNKNFNCSREKYLLFTRGPQTLQLPLVLSVSLKDNIQCFSELINIF